MLVQVLLAEPLVIHEAEPVLRLCVPLLRRLVEIPRRPGVLPVAVADLREHAERVGVALRRGLPVELLRLREILLHSSPVIAEVSEPHLREHMPVEGGLLIPLRGLPVVLRDSLTVVVHLPEAADRVVVPLLGGLLIPLEGPRGVLPHSLPPVVHGAEPEGREGVPVLRRLPVPPEGLAVVLLHLPAVAVHLTEPELLVGVKGEPLAVVRGLTVPVGGLRDAAPAARVVVHLGKRALRGGIAVLRGPPVPERGLGGALLDSLPPEVHLPEPVLRLRVPLLRGLPEPLRGLTVVLLHALSPVVHRGKPQLCVRISRLGGLPGALLRGAVLLLLCVRHRRGGGFRGRAFCCVRGGGALSGAFVHRCRGFGGGRPGLRGSECALRQKRGCQRRGGQCRDQSARTPRGTS